MLIQLPHRQEEKRTEVALSDSSVNISDNSTQLSDPLANAIWQHI